jgi:deoxyribodipyrimidine photo-lyase
MGIAVCWFRRDLRLEDNTALHHAMRSGLPVLPLFIFDTEILDELPRDDARLSFIYDHLRSIHEELETQGSSLLVRQGRPEDAWKELLSSHEIREVYFNRDYEPYARERDERIRKILSERGVQVFEYKDQVIFERDEIVKKDGRPYTVFTPYKNQWINQFHPPQHKPLPAPAMENLYQHESKFPPLEEIGFTRSAVPVREFDLSGLHNYASLRDFPAEDATTHLGPHLRFGTAGIRKLIEDLGPSDGVFLGELIWREFFMQILYHFPEVVDQNFHAKYNGIEWRNDESEFERWCTGQTGYPMVDAGMRQLNETGTMHNRVRMVTASFLCKHLLIDWRRGEAYFAKILLDYELSSNNGNWQWAAGTGCDAAPYFRIFNPTAQLRKFDPKLEYTRRWIPEFGTSDYPPPMVDHKASRERALDVYRKGIIS